MRYLPIVLLLSGCVNVSAVKSLTIDPSSKPVVVTSTATADCKDFLFIIHCDLYLNLEKH